MATDAPPDPTRRDFMRSVGALGAAVRLSAHVGAPDSAAAMRKGLDAGSGEIPRRPLGRTGVQVSAIGVGGHHLGDLSTVDDAVRLVHEAMDAGITFFDNCWEYYNGKTENWLGRALRGRRDKVFLMTNCTHGRSGQHALQTLEESLRRLQTDHLDLWQIHGIVYDKDPELGTMRVSEEIDALRTLGLDPYGFLVFPRIIIRVPARPRRPRRRRGCGPGDDVGGGDEPLRHRGRRRGLHGPLQCLRPLTRP
jgi:hypothetical protein